jgi:hypothetical protein
MVIRYSPGVALLDPSSLPVRARARDRFLGFPADGLSPPLSIRRDAHVTSRISSSGFWALLRTLELLFGSRLALFTLLGVLIGTNLSIQLERACLLTHGLLIHALFVLFFVGVRCAGIERRPSQRAGGRRAGRDSCAGGAPPMRLAALIPLLWPLQGTVGFVDKTCAHFGDRTARNAMLAIITAVRGVLSASALLETARRAHGSTTAIRTRERDWICCIRTR